MVQIVLFLISFLNSLKQTVCTFHQKLCFFVKNMNSIYDTVDEPEGKTASGSHRRHFDTCMRLAKMSSLTHKHGCVIVNTKTNEIVGSGYNKKVTHHSVGSSIHAEVDAIKSVRSKMHHRGPYDMYIIRLGSPHGYNTKYSKPCEVCTKFIIRKFHHRIRKVYYSINTI